MSKTWWFVVAVLVALVIISTAYGNRFGAIGGAAILLGTIIYATLANRRASPREEARAERGARELREELDAEDNP